MEIHGHIKSEIMLDLKSALEYAVSIRNNKYENCNCYWNEIMNGQTKEHKLFQTGKLFPLSVLCRTVRSKLFVMNFFKYPQSELTQCVEFSGSLSFSSFIATYQHTPIQ